MNYIADEKTISSLCRKLSPPLVTLLAKGSEVQYLTLRNAILILQRRPDVLRNDVRVFFCKYNDPIYVKVTKLELIFMLASENNIREVLQELKEYVPSRIGLSDTNSASDTPQKLMCTLCGNL